MNATEENDPMKLPKSVHDMHIPHPNNEQLKFYNDLLYSLHKSCCRVCTILNLTISESLVRWLEE